MIEVLKFVFSSFWVFIGTFILLSLIVRGFIVLALALLALVFGTPKIKKELKK